MNQSKIEAGQPEQKPNSEQQPIESTSAPAIGNTNVSGCTGDELFNRLKDYLEYHFEIFPDENEMEDIIDLAVKQDGFLSNKGYKWERINSNPREKAFYEQWLKENEPRPGLNFGQGILQDLFIERGEDSPFTKKWITEITNRDRMIAATVIQWLGTNCGMAFLYDALKRFGARIEEVR